jgi:nucleoside-diphosphate-sugar epimerase
MWAWVGSEDVASAHRLVMERAAEIEPHGVYFCNADDTTVLEPTQELVERFKPELAFASRPLMGHESLLSNRRLRETVGWKHKTKWRDLIAR